VRDAIAFKTLLTILRTAFNIPSAVKLRDGSYVPFSVPSAITLDALRYLVAEKLGCFPGLVRLRYRLDSDKQKAGATSIQSEEELRIFTDRMRLLIVPQKLPSGKISTRVLKPVRVDFEDAAAEGGTQEAPASKVAGKKVRLQNGVQYSRCLEHFAVSATAPFHNHPNR
jgi:hypothetical protein